MRFKDWLGMAKTFLLIEFIPGSMCFNIINLQRRVEWLEVERAMDAAFEGIEWI